MEVNPLQRPIVAANIAPEKLAGNPSLTRDQKITEASRQFEAVLLRQILGDAQKTVISSEFTDHSTAAGIYQDIVTNTLADNISKSGAFGLAKTFSQQLNRPVHVGAGAGPAAAPAAKSARPVGVVTGRSVRHVMGGGPAEPRPHRLTNVPVQQP